MIEDIFVKFIKMVKVGYPSVSKAYSVSVDATRVVRYVGMFKSFNDIVGGIFTQYHISLDGKRDNDIKNTVHEIKNNKFEKADEIEIEVICLHTIEK